MAYDGLLVFGGMEIANSSRCSAYVRAGIAPVTMKVQHDDSWGWTAWAEGDPEYRTPVLDEPPWWSVDDRDSDDFAGVWPLEVRGLATTEHERPVVEASGDGGGFGRGRWKPRVLTVRAMLIAATPAGLEYGLRWLTDALLGSLCGNEQGDVLCYYAVAPDLDTEQVLEDEAAARACVDSYRRQLHRVSMTKAPAVDEWWGRQPGVDVSALGTRAGTSSAPCCATVSFELTAGVPQAYWPEQLVADSVSWASAAVRGTTFTVAGADGRCHDDGCGSAVSALRDPEGPLAPIVVRPVLAGGVPRPPIITKRTAVTIPAAMLPPQGEAVPTVRIRTGARPERYLRVQLAPNPLGNAPSAVVACGACDGLTVRYLPADSELVLDGVTGRATVTAPGGEVMDATSVVMGPDGGPWVPPILDCRMDYTLVCDAAGDVPDEVRLGVGVSWREV